MSIISKRLYEIPESAAMRISKEAVALSAAGRAIINLSEGEPDFDVPVEIQNAAIDAIRRNAGRYTAADGILPLKEAVCAKFARENFIEYRPENISVAAGAKHVIYNALLSTLEPGDEVLIVSPYWLSYPDMVLLAGGEPVVVETHQDEQFKLDPTLLGASISERTKWLILNSPSNPTGATYSHAEVRAIADVLLQHPNVWIMSDDVYEHFTYDNLAFATLAQVEPELKERTLTINGISKSFAMTGWRIGYAGGPTSIISAMRKVMSQSTSNPCTISQYAAIQCLEHHAEFLVKNCAEYQRKRDMVVDLLSAIPELRCDAPQGGLYVLPRIESMRHGGHCGKASVPNDVGFCEMLLANSGVALVPGTVFGAPGFVRMSFAAADATLNKACQRIREFCAAV